jgi:hypothetical protein
MRPTALAAILAISLTSCVPDHADTEPEKEQLSPAEELAKLGKIAADANSEIRVEGTIDDTATFTADYSPEKQTLIYELKTGDTIERFAVSPVEAIYSKTGRSDQLVNRDAVFPNGKDWPYASRMAAPFLDAINGYSATLHSFYIDSVEASAIDENENARDLIWFKLRPNKDTIHDLLFMEVSKASEILMGLDPKTGLLRCVRSTSSKTGQLSDILAH